MHERKANAILKADHCIEDYCEKNNIPLSAMCGPVISKRYYWEWIFDYTSKTKPKHEVRLYIDILGVVVVHRLIEKEQAKVEGNSQRGQEQPKERTANGVWGANHI